jgi:hypothetical protein
MRGGDFQKVVITCLDIPKYQSPINIYLILVMPLPDGGSLTLLKLAPFSEVPSLHRRFTPIPG